MECSAGRILNTGKREDLQMKNTVIDGTQYRLEQAAYEQGYEEGRRDTERMNKEAIRCRECRYRLTSNGTFDKRRKWYCCSLGHQGWTNNWLPADVFRQDFFCADGDRREDEK